VSRVPVPGRAQESFRILRGAIGGGAVACAPSVECYAGAVHSTLVAQNGVTLEVHLLGAGDVAALQRFNAVLSEETRAVFLPHAYDEVTVRRYVERNRLGEDRAYVLKTGAEIIGYFFLWEFNHPVPIVGIGLADTWQGQGLGFPMLQRLMADARAAGRDAIELTTVPGNARAFRLYRRAGFEPVGDVDNVAGDGRVVREHRMFLALRPGVRPAERNFGPPAE
jgi:RimJ/RimL family protein N-acetyltransferase